MQCDECNKGTLQHKKVDYVLLGVNLGKFEALVCSSCGETIYDGETFKQIEKIAKQKGIWGISGKTTIGTSGNALDVKLPKALIEFNLENIELVEYYTNVKTMKALWAAAYFIGSFLFYFYNQILWDRVTLLIPIADKFLKVHPFFDMNIIALIILSYCIIMGIIDFTNFIFSFIGRVRIMPKGIGPTDIISQMTTEVEQFIQTMQEYMGYKKAMQLQRR